MAGRYIFLLISGCMAASVLSAPGKPIYLGYQDSIGQYSFGYSSPSSARSEVRTSDGATHGSYSYVDETGTIHKAEYIADAQNGFRVIATNLPQPPLPVEDTPEVTAARAAHLQALETAARRAEQAVSSGNQTRSPAPRDAVNNSSGIISEMTGTLNIGSNRNNEVEQEDVKQQMRSAGKVTANGSNMIEERNSKRNSEMAEILGTSDEDGDAMSEVIDSIKIQSMAAEPQGLVENWIKSSQPVYEILPGSLGIHASRIQQSSNTQGAPGDVDSPNSKLGVRELEIEGMKMWERTSGSEKQTNLQSSVSGSAFAPINIEPLASYSTFLGYPQYFPYVSYGVL